ncbi:M61 family metallopeptidase, partial [Dyella sp.]|uniref:M61 family metallopeptidase n=1 Tax=Dyella sp. TaxID=1869338 RepID=UPI003F81CD9A
MSLAFSSSRATLVRRKSLRLTVAISTVLAAAVASAQPAWTDSVPAPQDTAYPGTVTLQVDASDTAQGIFRVRESIPVQPGALTLLYPQWIPGDHSPTGPIAMLAGLRLSANGQPLKWIRDKYNVYAFHLDVPAGVSTVEAQFQYLSPRDGGYEITDRMMDMEWSKLALYPAGHYTRGITFAPSLTLPHGWQFGTALESASTSGDTTTFKPVMFNNLVDSPVYAGQYFKRVDLTPKGGAPVHLDIVADAPKYLQITPAQLQAHRNLAAQATTLFGSHHYDHYDFLFALSDEFGGIGREHHQSSENGVKPGYFTDWAKGEAGRELLPHEYTHSWNGKFRRPAGQNVPNFNTPMDNELLWVYEGQTQYWGNVLAARSGLVSPAGARDALAASAARYDSVAGRVWRTVQDTVYDPLLNARRPLGWPNWQRSEDYYVEGMLLWL